jgi:hypothetical protein
VELRTVLRGYERGGPAASPAAGVGDEELQVKLVLRSRIHAEKLHDSETATGFLAKPSSLLQL